MELLIGVVAFAEIKRNKFDYIASQDLVADFYTAWDVIAQHVRNFFNNAIVSYGLSLLLRWGAMDAEAYPGVAANIVNMLWHIGTHQEAIQSSFWTRTQEAAFTALLQYEVVQIQRWITDFSARNMELIMAQAVRLAPVFK